jgi:dTDP-4-amino-4,6-dideoxygalactose transaminase
MPGLPLIEDAAQTIGARRKIGGQWTMAGERATIGTFSYFPSKNLGGYGDGGMIVTQDDAIAARLFKLRTHGATTTYYHDEVGFNSRLDALQAHLKAKGIGNAVYYPLPLHLQKCFAYLGLTSGRYPESERAAKEVLSLPVYPELTRSQQNETIAAVREFYGR